MTQSILRCYFVYGFGISAISESTGQDPATIRDELRGAGLTIKDNHDYDPVSWSLTCGDSYNSFLEYLQRRGHLSQVDQARELEVSRGAIARAHRAFRHYIANSGGGHSVGDQGEDSTA